MPYLVLILDKPPYNNFVSPFSIRYLSKTKELLVTILLEMMEFPLDKTILPITASELTRVLTILPSGHINGINDNPTSIPKLPNL